MGRYCVIHENLHREGLAHAYLPGAGASIHKVAEKGKPGFRHIPFSETRRSGGHEEEPEPLQEEPGSFGSLLYWVAFDLYYLPVVKYQFFCWSSVLPAASLAPVVTVALYLVLDASMVEDVP